MACEAVFVGLGSNLGERLENILQALEFIQGMPLTKILDYSSVYETAPVGYRAQGNFLNQVIQITTGQTPVSFLEKSLVIEKKLGRRRRIKWGPRTLDVDLLFWGNLVVQTDALVLPHPQIESRRFVLEPLCEIAPQFVTPLNQKTVQQLRDECADRNAVTLYLPKEEFTFK